MRILKQYLIGFRTTLCSFAISSVSIAFIPLLQMTEGATQRMLSYAIAALFWLGIIFGCVIHRMAGIKLLEVRRRLRTEEPIRRQRFIGLITFHADTINIVIYAIFAVCFVLVAVDCFFHCISEHIVFPAISVMLFTFSLHCVIDGKYYNLYLRIKEGVNYGNE